MDLKEDMGMDLLVKKNSMTKIILVLSILLLSHCAHKDLDFNPLTSIAKKILEVNFEN
jgi:hypothetical protein